MKSKKSKHHRITFIDLHGKRREIYLSGNYDDLVVEGFCNIVKRLSHVQRFGGELTRQETNHLETLLPELRKRLIEFGLIEGKIVERIPTIEKLLDAYRKTRVNVKESSRIFDTRIFRYLVEHFGKRKRIDTITPVEAAEIKHYLVNERTKGHGKLKPSSANRAVTAIKPIFRFAVDCGYLAVSPFAKVKGGSSSRENTEYISLQCLEDVFVPCGNNLEYRSLLAIARYEGLRVPSEIRDLKFSDFRNIETGIIFTIPVTEKRTKDEYRSLWNFCLILRNYESIGKRDRSNFLNIAERIRMLEL